jgi:hypothetical protein
VAEARRRLSAFDDEALGAALRELGGAIEMPVARPAGGQDVAARARARLEASGTEPRRGWAARWTGPAGRRPLRRSLVLALAALLVLAAVAGAVTAWLPGIRIIFGDGPPPSPSGEASPSDAVGSSLGPIGMTLGLGASVPLDEAERLAGVDLILPTDPAIGPPDAVFVNAGRVSLVWAARPGLPAAGSDGIGLLISEFRGAVDDSYYRKVVNAPASVAEVTVNGARGYFIGGPPHFFVYVDENGNDVDASHRVVGDTLIWADGPVTYRLESGLDMGAAIRLAESLR